MAPAATSRQRRGKGDEVVAGVLQEGSSSSAYQSSGISLLLPSLRGTILVTGIYVFFLAFGYFQESLFKIGVKGDMFRYPMFIVALLCCSNVIFSGAILWFEQRNDFHMCDVEPPSIDDAGVHHTLKSPSAPGAGPKKKRSFLSQTITGIDSFTLRETALTSVTYVLSMLCTNYALSHVNYPTQILVKSAKSVPVVLGGLMFFGKRYPVHDYMSVTVITLALILFNLSSSNSSKKAGHQTFLGLALLGVSLFCDSMTGPRQDRLLSKVKLSSTHLMFLTNLCATVISCAAWFILEGPDAASFCLRHPEAISQILYYCISASLGQLFIFGTLTEFGSLHLTLITTTRKFFTVLLSVLLFGHNISALQWMCVISIFVTLGVQSYCTKKLKLKAKTAEKEQ